MPWLITAQEIWGRNGLLQAEGAETFVTHRHPADWLADQLDAIKALARSGNGPRSMHIMMAIEITEKQFARMADIACD